MEIKKILDNKLPLMGIATIFILFSHFSSENTAVLTAQHLTSFGVELFLIISGMGCYYSMQKRTSGEFLKRRVLRIFPVYLAVLICYGIYICLRFDEPVWYFLVHNEAFTSLFVYGEISGWFIVAIVLFYLLTPLLNKLINYKWYYAVWLAIILWVISAQLEYYTHGSFYMVNNFVIVRLPSYILGLLLGYFLKRKPDVKIPTRLVVLGEIVSVGLMIANLVLNDQNFGFIIKIIAVPYAFFTMMLLGQLLDKIPVGVLSFFGMISLEVYLIFEKILSVFTWDIGIIHSDMVTNLIAMAITIAVAELMRLVRVLIERLREHALARKELQ